MERKIIKYRWWIIAGSFVLTFLLAGLLSRIDIDGDISNYFPGNMESAKNTEKIEEIFGNQDIVMILFECEDIINEESLTRVKRIERTLKRVDGIRKTTSVFGSNHIYGKEGAMYVEPTIKRIPRTAAAIKEIKSTILENDLVKNVVVADDFRSTAIIATLDNEVVEDSVFASIIEILEEYPGTERVHFGGLPYLRQTISKDMVNDALTIVPVALLLMIIFLFVVFREWRGLVLPFLVVIMSSILSLALLPVLEWKFTLISILAPVMLIAVANDYGIHIIAKYQEINASSSLPGMKEISIMIFRKLWKPIFLTGITTIAGLAALLAHTMIPARQMAVITGIGLVFALFYSIILLPGLLSLLKRSKPIKNLANTKADARKNLLNRLGVFIVSHHKRIPYAALGITLAIGVGIFFLKVDSNEENFFPRKHAVKQAARLINDKYGGSESLSLLFTGDMLDPESLSRIDRYKRKLEKDANIDQVMCFPDVVRQISKALNDKGSELYDRIPPTREAVAQYMELYNMNGDPGTLDQLVDFNYHNSHMVIRVKNMSNVAVNMVVEKIRMMTLNDDSLTAIGGSGYVRAQLADKVVRGQFYSLSIALVIIFLVLSAIFRSFRAGMLSIIPLSMSILLLFGIMGVAGVRLDVATALLSSIMIGVGVDYTIHFLWRYREERFQHKTPGEAVITTLSTTGRGILFNALSVIVGFAVLIFSSFTPIRFFGILVVVSILSCLVGALVILPALVLNGRYQFLEPESMPEPDEKADEAKSDEESEDEKFKIAI